MTFRRPLGATCCIVAALAAGATSAAPTPAPSADEARFRSIYRELVETNTTLSSGSCTEAASRMAARLRAAGMPDGAIKVLAPVDRPKSGSLVATYAGRDPKLAPIGLLAHIDVVEAHREDWKRDPFVLVEEDGFFYARGASDDKAMASVFTDLLVGWAAQGYRPKRGVTLALTCGEETSETFNGVKWLLSTQPDLMRAKFFLNEGAGGLLDAQGRHVSLEVQAGEKVYQNYTLLLTHPGGHSSRPTRENPIVRMSVALARLGAYQFPASLNDATRGYFAAQAELQPPDVAADMRAILASPADDAAAGRLWTANPSWNGMLRTTCVATQFQGGHAPNALPQRVSVNVNCRILPGVPVEQVRQDLVRILADDTIAVTLAGEEGFSAPVPPLTDEVLQPIRTITHDLWPEAHVVPTMSTGGTDGRYLNAAGIPTYGVSGMFSDAEGSHAHGLDERIRVRSLLDGRQFLQRLVAVYTAR